MSRRLLRQSVIRASRSNDMGLFSECGDKNQRTGERREWEPLVSNKLFVPGRVGFSHFRAYDEPMSHECPFCRAIADPKQSWGESLVWEFPHSFAILGPWQYYTGYCLLVSREHASELSQLGTRRTAFLEEMAKLAEAIETCFQPHKLNYELLGNQVPHLHWHLFPRSLEDPDRLRAVWFALEKAATDPKEKERLQTGAVSRSEAVSKLKARLGVLC